MNKPTPGRIIHYDFDGHTCTPGIVTGVKSDSFNARIFRDEPVQPNEEVWVEHMPLEPADGIWHWPERVE